MSTKPPIVGTIYTNDRAGFLKLVADANEHHGTHVLMNAFPSGDKLLAIFRQRERDEPKGGFFDPLDVG